MNLLHLVVLAPMVLAAATSLTLPDEAQEGVGIQLWDDDGNQMYIHESEFAQYNITVQPGTADPPPTAVVTATATATATATSPAKRGLPNGDSITCLWNTPVPIGELHDDMVFFADYLGCGITYGTNQFARYKYVALIRWEGSTVMYTCNYSGTSRVWGGPELVSYVEQVFNYCNRNSVAAWYFDNYRKVSWGYTTRNNGYCGPAQ